MSISTSVLCLVAAGILVSWIVLWSAAYNVGFRRGDDRASRELSLSAAPVTDPLMGDQTVGEGVIATRPSPPTSQPAAIQPSARQPAAPAGATARLAGTQGVRGVMVPPEPEPRVAGLNYYAIEGQLDRESAQLIVAFLAEHNVASVAVDTSPRGSNNQRSYRVYGLQGFSSAEFRSPGRTEYEQRISQLGEIFRNDPRGWTDFSRTNWERF